MSVAAVLLGYGGTMLLVSALGLDGSNGTHDRLPTTTAMAAAALATGALAMTGPTPPKKGEPGYVRHVLCVEARSAWPVPEVTGVCCLLCSFYATGIWRPCTLASWNLCCLQVCVLCQVTLATGVWGLHTWLTHYSSTQTNLCATRPAGVHAYRAYGNRSSATDMIPPAALAVRRVHVARAVRCAMPSDVDNSCCCMFHAYVTRPARD